MMERHRKEEWELLKNHLIQQREILQRLMEIAQAQQMKQIEAKFERYRYLISIHKRIHYSPNLIQ